MRAPGRRSPAALFLVDNKGRSKGLAVQVSLPEGLPPQASDQGLWRCLCPAGQPTSITAAPVNRGRQPRPQCPARHRVLGKLSQEGPGPWLLSETQQGKHTSPTPPTPALGVPGARRTLTSEGGDRLKASRLQRACTRGEVHQQGPQLRSRWDSPGPPRLSRGLGLTRSWVE